MSRKFLIGIGIVLALLLVIALGSGCSARIGPGEHGWVLWDVCGYEGGVAAELQVLAVTARLGCTNPESPPATDEEEDDE